MAIIIPGTGATGPIQTLTETVKNTSGGTLLKGTPVRITGATGQEANVGPADASTAFPANFVLAETLAPGESGQAVALGFINNVSVPNASLFTAGQEVWLAVGGGWTTTRPTGAANIQLLGNIVKVNTSNNTVSGIFAPQNIEYLPNLTQGKVWVGSASGLPEESDPAFSGQIINGVAHFVETTAPTFRRNAAGQNIGPLVAGDKWYNPSTRREGFWNGTYWLSEPLEQAVNEGTAIGATGFTTTNVAVPFSIFIHSFEVRFTNSSGTPTNGSNLFVGTIDLRGWSNTPPTYVSVPFNNNTDSPRTVTGVNQVYIPNVIDRVQTQTPSRLGLSTQIAVTETGSSYCQITTLFRYSFIL